MGHTHLNTSEASSFGNNNKGQDKDRTNTIFSWMLFQPDTKNFPEGDKEWKLPQMDRCINNQQLLKNLTPIIATSLGHMDQERKDLQSTKSVKSEVDFEEDRDFYPGAESVKTHELCATIIPFNINKKGFSNLAGAFPQKSNRGNLYVMVVYDYDSNIILAEPIKDRQAATILDVFLKTHKVLKAIYREPKVYIMVNKFSSDLKEAMKNYEIDF